MTNLTTTMILLDELMKIDSSVKPYRRRRQHLPRRPASLLGSVTIIATMMLMLMMMMTKPSTTTLTTTPWTADAFVTVSRPSVGRSKTVLFLEDWVADMIDGELYRQGHRKEYEEAWMEKNRRAVLSRIETDFGGLVVSNEDNTMNMNDNDSKMMMMMNDDDRSEYRQHAKDVRLAERDPQQYCADRCVATGHCDVYEDMYEMTALQVIQFCTECVLSEEEEECDLPGAFFKNVKDDGDMQVAESNDGDGSSGPTLMP